MRNTRHLTHLLALIIFTTILSGISLASEPLEGTINETGWGKFKLKGKDDILRLVHVSKKLTRFSPNSWRPVIGDKVSLTYTKVQKRSSAILRADVIKLVKAGPNTVVMGSPVKVKITETGKSGVKAEIGDTGKIVKFTRHRGSKYHPDGWVPAAGEEATIEFTIKPAKLTFGLNYLITKITRTPKKK